MNEKFKHIEVKEYLKEKLCRLLHREIKVNVKLVGCWEKGVFKTIFAAREINKIVRTKSKFIFSLRQFLQIAQDFFSCYWFFFPSHFHHKKWKLRECMRICMKNFHILYKVSCIIIIAICFFPPFILFSFFIFSTILALFSLPPSTFFSFSIQHIYVKETAFANSAFGRVFCLHLLFLREGLIVKFS